ncbi:uncharacterized protein LOC129854574 isoform X2 [Salvelinus fontinalis]|uniref:uncharacterized protein LOC129854574 isoform X2 n=1 Tax=Salvelinus fontinalis TaxID=8038 RepID=UPI002485D802|nr:uncharacterized protein LOC129854574 isoform X2 [Salvelinus fontinalis]
MQCCVWGCKAQYRKGGGLGFFRFPTGENKIAQSQRRTWIQMVKREDPEPDLPSRVSGKLVLQMGNDWHPTTSSRICGRHFVLKKPNLHPDHPDFAPSLFLRPEDYALSPNTAQTEGKRNMQSYDRAVKKKCLDLSEVGGADLRDSYADNTEETEEQDLGTCVSCEVLRKSLNDLQSRHDALQVEAVNLRMERDFYKEKASQSSLFVDTFTDRDNQTHTVREVPSMAKQNGMNQQCTGMVEEPCLMEVEELCPVKVEEPCLMEVEGPCSVKVEELCPVKVEGDYDQVLIKEEEQQVQIELCSPLASQDKVTHVSQDKPTQHNNIMKATRRPCLLAQDKPIQIVNTMSLTRVVAPRPPSQVTKDKPIQLAKTNNQCSVKVEESCFVKVEVDYDQMSIKEAEQQVQIEICSPLASQDKVTNVARRLPIHVPKDKPIQLAKAVVESHLMTNHLPGSQTTAEPLQKTPLSAQRTPVAGKLIQRSITNTERDELLWLGYMKWNVHLPVSTIRTAHKFQTPRATVQYLLHAVFSQCELATSNLKGIPALGLNKLDPDKLSAIRQFVTTKFRRLDMRQCGKDWVKCRRQITSMLRNIRKEDRKMRGLSGNLCMIEKVLTDQSLPSQPSPLSFPSISQQHTAAFYSPTEEEEILCLES